MQNSEQFWNANGRYRANAWDRQPPENTSTFEDSPNNGSHTQRNSTNPYFTQQQSTYYDSEPSYNDPKQRTQQSEQYPSTTSNQYFQQQYFPSNNSQYERWSNRDYPTSQPFNDSRTTAQLPPFLTNDERTTVKNRPPYLHDVPNFYSGTTNNARTTTHDAQYPVPSPSLFGPNPLISSMMSMLPPGMSVNMAVPFMNERDYVNDQLFGNFDIPQDLDEEYSGSSFPASSSRLNHIQQAQNPSGSPPNGTAAPSTSQGQQNGQTFDEKYLRELWSRPSPNQGTRPSPSNSTASANPPIVAATAAQAPSTQSPPITAPSPVSGTSYSAVLMNGTSRHTPSPPASVPSIPTSSSPTQDNPTGLPTEMGVVCLLKDSYGFIKCCEREEDLFFHFSALPRDVSIDTIRIGTEFQFNVAMDTRAGKLNAINLKLLSKGTVKFEEMILERVRGSVTREIKDDSDENDYGLVEFKNATGEVESLPFRSKDLDEPRVPLKVQDEVEFDVVINKRNQLRSGARVLLVRFGGLREFGIVHSVKDNFGFIRCADSPRSLYFHFRDVVLLQRDQEITKGIEVEFSVANDERANKLCAVRVRGLPKGSISFTTQSEERYRGIVEKELNSAAFPRRGEEEDKGVISMTLPDTGFESLLFGSTDIRAGPGRVTLKCGDEVEFHILVDKRTNKKHATDIALVRSSFEKREMGVVCSVKKNYGHITCQEQDEDLFFHFSDFEDLPILQQQHQELCAGMEVEFVIVPDLRTGKTKAAKIRLLKEGTVKFEDVGEERYRGIVKRECKPGQTGFIGRRQRADLGVITILDLVQEMGNLSLDSSRASAASLNGINGSSLGEDGLTFGCNDLRDKNVTLWPGDIVEFNIAIEKRTRIRSAVNIELVKPKELPREVGVISSVKNSFGFIKSTEREEEVYFHFSELDKTIDESSLQPGQELEFSVVKNSWFKKLLAIRIKPVAKGTVKFHKLIEGRYKGIVDREPRGRGRHTEGYYPGKLSCRIDTIPGMQPTDDKVIFLEFDPSDVDPRYSIKRNDKVEFSVVEDARTRTKRATNIQPLRETGIITSIKDGIGIISRDDKSTEDEVTFYVSEQDASVDLPVGTVVEFLATLNTRTKTMNANDVKPLELGKKRITKSASLLPPMTGGSLGGKSGVVVLRQPIPGDGTRGFTAVGRGKLLSEDRDRLLSSYFQPQQQASNSNNNNNNNGYGILSGLPSIQNHYASLTEILEQQ